MGDCSRYRLFLKIYVKKEKNNLLLQILLISNIIEK